MIDAVLFDLDGTLLDIDIEGFLRRYFSVLGPAMAPLLGDEADPRVALTAVISGTEAMQSDHPGRTNMDVFVERFYAETGVDLLSGTPAETIASFYANVFPTLGDSLGPRPGALESLEAARAAGLKVAVATNPIFPLVAIKERMRWVGVDVADVDTVTSYETSTACKPFSAYFIETAERLGVEPDRCLMVGDDSTLDMPAAHTGMKTFYVGDAPLPDSDWSGSMLDVARLLSDLAR
jgi:FMN phosphatase YigB (HAD superfamily)